MNETIKILNEKRSTLERILQLEDNLKLVAKDLNTVNQNVQNVSKEIASAIGAIIEQTNRQFQIIGTQVFNLNQAAETLIELTDPVQFAETKAKLIAEAPQRQLEHKRKVLDEEATEFQKLIDAGQITPALVIEDGTVMAGNEFDKDGNRTYDYQGTLFVQFDQIRPELKGVFQGKAVGDKIEAMPGVTFEVTAIYKIVQQQLAVTAPEVVASQPE